LADAVAADPDGEVNDCALVPALLEQLPAPRRPWLLVADRQFGDLKQPGRIEAAGYHFLLRRNAKTHFHPDPQRAADAGRDPAGRRVVQQWGWLGSGPRRLYVRQITLERPGAEDVVLVTDLLDAARYPAADLLAVYLRRWGIEQVFQQITEVFGLARFIGSSAEATVFQAAYCLLLYDVIQVVKAQLAAGARRQRAEVSTAKLFADIRAELVSLCRLVPAAVLARLIDAGTGAEGVRQRLRERLRGCWRPRYQKAVEGKPRARRVKARGSGAHTSVYRLQQKNRASTKKNA